MDPAAVGNADELDGTLLAALLDVDAFLFEVADLEGPF